MPKQWKIPTHGVYLELMTEADLTILRKFKNCISLAYSVLTDILIMNFNEAVYSGKSKTAAGPPARSKFCGSRSLIGPSDPRRRGQ